MGASVYGERKGERVIVVFHILEVGTAQLLTLLIEPNNSSSCVVYSALLCTFSTNSGCKLRMAATAIREIGSS